MNVSDLNLIGSKLMDLGQGANSDHPVYTDTMYRKRREEIRRLSIGHKVGGRINHVNYSKSEHKLWEHIYRSARHMQEEMYCEQYLESIHKLESSKVFRPDKAPELEDLDAWVNEVSGWHLKPVGGMLSQREFLNCLAFKVFCSGQHLRHPERPDYSPEPDIMHEYLGHIPSFAEPGLCEIAQQLGALSLGATDQQVKGIGTIYFFTIEFGLCYQTRGSGREAIKIYGAGPAGSTAEMRRIKECIDNRHHPMFKEAIKRFDLDRHNLPTEVENEDLQSILYVAKNYQDFLSQIRQYVSRFERNFKLKYDEKRVCYVADRELSFINNPTLPPSQQKLRTDQ